MNRSPRLGGIVLAATFALGLLAAGWQSLVPVARRRLLTPRCLQGSRSIGAPPHPEIAMSVQTLNPSSLFQPAMYPQVAVATGTRMVFVAVQAPLDARGQLVGPRTERQLHHDPAAAGWQPQAPPSPDRVPWREGAGTEE